MNFATPLVHVFQVMLVPFIHNPVTGRVFACEPSPVSTQMRRLNFILHINGLSTQTLGHQRTSSSVPEERLLLIRALDKI